MSPHCQAIGERATGFGADRGFAVARQLEDVLAGILVSGGALVDSLAGDRQLFLLRMSSALRRRWMGMYLAVATGVVIVMVAMVLQGSCWLLLTLL